MIDRRLMFSEWFESVKKAVREHTTAQDVARIVVLVDRWFLMSSADWHTLRSFMSPHDHGSHTALGGQLYLCKFEDASTFPHAVDVVIAFPRNSRTDRSVASAVSRIHVGPPVGHTHIVREGTMFLSVWNWAEHRAENRRERRTRKKRRRSQ